MEQKLRYLIEDAGEAIFYDRKFRSVLEDHLPYLLDHPQTQYITILPSDAWRYEFDLYGLLAKMGVPAYLRWLSMRMMGYASMQQLVDKDNPPTAIIMPPSSIVNQIRQLHMSTSG